MPYEVKVTGEQLKELWAKTEWNNPFDSYCSNDDKMWEFLYLNDCCNEVLKEGFSSLDIDNEDANEILNRMDKYWCKNLIDKYITRHYEDVKEAFNIWWWSQHDVSDYEE